MMVDALAEHRSMDERLRNRWDAMQSNVIEH